MSRRRPPRLLPPARLRCALVPPLLFLFLSVYVIPVCADFLTSDLAGPFVRRLGLTSCPDNLSITDPSPTLSATSINTDGAACTDGDISLHVSPPNPPPGGELARYLSGERSAGAFLAVSVKRAVPCPSTTFSERSYLVFLRPNANLSIVWANVFFRGDTVLQRASGNASYVFRKDVRYVVVNSICLYSQLSSEEVDDQRGEKCFPSHAVVRTPRGDVPMSRLRTGDAVWADGAYTTIVGWTHRDPHYYGAFVMATVANGRRMIASHGHLVYADGHLVEMRNVHVGMTLMLANGSQTVVQNVSVVWRTGLFNPQTAVGNIVVDGFRTSSYTTAVPPFSAHALLLPVRALANVGVDVLDWTGGWPWVWS